MAYCNDCNQEITWAETQNGKNIALEVVDSKKVTSDGSDRLWSNGYRVHTVVKGKDALANPTDRKLLRPLYLCHFDTCTARTR